MTVLDLDNLRDLATFARIAEAEGIRQTSGRCDRPIQLAGVRRIWHKPSATVLHELNSAEMPGGVLVMACGNRRASHCEACSTLYKYDTYNLIVAGLRGGKDVSATVADNPRLFCTFTAPSFGPVHLGPAKSGERRPCHPRRSGPSCGRWHRSDDPLIGTPIDPDTYDYLGHVLFNAMASALWSRTVTEIRRALARRLGLTRAEAAQLYTVVFAKVAEYQARGVVHFHGVIRLDGPDGSGSLALVNVSTETLAEAVEIGVRRASVQTPDAPAVPSRTLTWGQQFDARPISATDLDGESPSSLSDVTVARYVAKYATKAAEAAGLDLSPIACRRCAGLGFVVLDVDLPDGITSTREVACQDCRGHGIRVNLNRLDLSPHARRLIDTCWRLGGMPELAELRLRKWAHMLGFRGHFSTKSRTYSTTLGALRQERADYQAAQREDVPDLDLYDESTILVVNDWSYVGRGHVDTPPPPRPDQEDRQ